MGAEPPKIGAKLRTVIKRYLGEDVHFSWDIDSQYKVDFHKCEIYWFDVAGIDFYSLVKLNVLNLFIFIGQIVKIAFDRISVDKKEPPSGLFQPYPAHYSVADGLSGKYCYIKTLWVPDIIQSESDIQKNLICYTGDDDNIKLMIQLLQVFIEFPPLINMIQLNYKIDIGGYKITADNWIGKFPFTQPPGFKCIIGYKDTTGFKNTFPYAAKDTLYALSTFPSLLNPYYIFAFNKSDEFCMEHYNATNWIFPTSDDNAKYWSEKKGMMENPIYGQNLRNALQHFTTKSEDVCPSEITISQNFIKNALIHDLTPKTLCICDCTKGGQDIKTCAAYCMNSFGTFKSGRDSIVDYTPKYWCWSNDKQNCITNVDKFNKDGTAIEVKTYKLINPISASKLACQNAHSPTGDTCTNAKWKIVPPNPDGPGTEKTGCICAIDGIYSSCEDCCRNLLDKYPTSWQNSTSTDCGQPAPGCKAPPPTPSWWQILFGAAGIILVLAIMAFLLRFIQHHYAPK